MRLRRVSANSDNGRTKLPVVLIGVSEGASLDALTIQAKNVKPNQLVKLQVSGMRLKKISDSYEIKMYTLSCIYLYIRNQS